jgi:pimeloyl-ACP methyl ester carboxylesterase
VKSQPTGIPIPVEILRNGARATLSIVLDAAPNEDNDSVETLYQSVSVDGSLRRVLLTAPKWLNHPRPAILILGGIGCYSIDVATDLQDAYRRLAVDLGRAGFAVVRLEKSGMGDSQGPPCMTVDLLTEMHSYEIALHALQSEPHVDKGRIYLLGHSIGTLMAPRIAKRQRVAGIIIVNGLGRNWIEYELWTLRRQLQLGGESPSAVDAKLAMKEICMHQLLVEKQPEPEIEQALPECKVYNNYPASAIYMQQAAALNPAEPWAELSVPLLAIHGTADFVTDEADHVRIVEIVNSSHAGIATLKEIDGMDHHLDVAGTESEAYDLRVKRHSSGPFDENLSHAILDWLCAREKCEVADGAESPLLRNNHNPGSR